MNRYVLAAASVILAEGIFSNDPLIAGGAAGEESRSVDAVSYADFQKMSRQARIELFNMFSPERQAALVAEHVRSWREDNRARLTVDQLEFINQEVLPAVTADMYKKLKNEEAATALRRMMEKARSLFSPEDVSAAFYMVGGRPNK